tara:strand:- start:1358 stop:1495 length:138 start_codon:yes stop_codon:yes gene_type:complete
MIAMTVSGTKSARYIMPRLHLSIFLNTSENAYAGPGQAEFGEEQV